MEDKLQRIREILDEIESASEETVDDSFKANFELLELPSIVCSIVDYLQPDLHPYEAAVYWYMFRHSVLETGDVYLRVSVRGLCSGVITSSSGQSSDLSYDSVKEALAGLEEKEVIRKMGEPNREGTPYRVYIPDEIPLCQERMEEEQEGPTPVDQEEELDHYNIRENRLKVFERDGYECQHCGKQLTRFTATLDHLQPISEGGDHSSGNLVTSCLHCNSRRGAKPVSEFMDDG